MANELTTRTNAIESALIDGDLSKLNDDQRLSYYRNVCESLGLNPLTKPFSYLRLNGKLVLYALKDATEQLRATRGVSITKLERERIDDVYAVTAYAQDKSGRTDSSIGAVSVGNLRGDNLANALMKAETKAKRRVTLSICGLGMLDETEVETIPNAQPITEVVTIAVNPHNVPPTEQEMIDAGTDGEPFDPDPPSSIKRIPEAAGEAFKQASKTNGKATATTFWTLADQKKVKTEASAIVSRYTVKGVTGNTTDWDKAQAELSAIVPA